MQPEHILILALCGLGVFHGFSLGGYLLLSPGTKPIANKLLGLLLVVFALRISKSIFLSFTSDLDFILISLGLSLILSFGPLFHFYVRSYLQKDCRLQKKDLLHLLPFAGFLVLNSLNLLSREFYLYFGIYFIYLHFLSYIITSFVWQKRFTRLVGNTSKLATQWLNLVHLGMGLIWFSYFMFLLDDVVPYIAGPITYSLVIYPLSFWAILKKVHQPKVKKYQKSRMDNQELADLINRLESYLQEKKPFLDPELKLPSLADQLNTTPHLLSQAVNESFGQNFQQFLNSYRVETAREMLVAKDRSHFTISSIAYDSGFNSLSAFNAAFKKLMQKTPSQYRKEHFHIQKT